MIWLIIDTVFIIVSLGSGVAAISLVSWLNKRFTAPFLSTYLYFIILVIIYGIYGIVNTYFVKSFISELIIPEQTAKILINFLPFIGLPVLITAWFMFIKLCYEFVERKMSNISAIIFFGVNVIGILLFVFQTSQYNNSDDFLVLSDYLKLGFTALTVISFSTAYIVLFTGMLKAKHKQKRRLYFGFAFISLFFNLITVIAFYFSDVNELLTKLSFVAFFIGQVPPVLFLYKFMNKEFATSNNTAIESVKINMITNYELSAREWQIVEHICKGYTNSQISDKLFISLQTVKDHVSRVYRKTGVKNRVQLVNKTGMLNNS